MTPEQLVEIPGIGEKMVEKIHQSVAAYFEALEAQATAPVEAFDRGRSSGRERGIGSEAAATEAVEATESSEPSAAEASEATSGEARSEPRK